MKRRVLACAGIGIAIIFIAGCAGNIRAEGGNSPKEPFSSPSSSFVGRLSLVLEAAPHRNVETQSFSGGFALRGSAAQGELDFSAPTGQIVMQLRWTSEGAILIKGQERQLYPSVQALLEQTTGASISPEQLFAWLQGQNASAASGDWQVDLSSYGRGRIVARRNAPTPAELRIVLEQP